MTSLLLLAACSRAPAPLPEGDPARPDVVLLSIDTLRSDHLGTYGYERDTSPFLDARAAEGTQFNQSWSPAPWTLPTHGTLLTGALPWTHGAIEDGLSLSSEVELLSESYSKAGYATIGVVATLYVGRKFGFSRGFDKFHDFGIDTEKKNLQESPDAEDVFKQALEFAREQEPGKPIFLFLHVYDVHYPYDAPGMWDEKFDRRGRRTDLKYRSYKHFKKHPPEREQMDHQVAQYDEEIAYVDHELEALHKTWTERRPAIFTVVADHGEEFLERGSWGHAHTLFPEQLHVPWITWGPGVQAQKVDHRVGIEDVAPTLASLSGVELAAPDGTSRSEWLKAGAPAESPGGKVAAQMASTSRFDTNKVRYATETHDLVWDFRHGHQSLCDRVADPACLKNVAKSDRETLSQLRGETEQYIGAPWEVMTPGSVTTDGVLLSDGRVSPRGGQAMEAGARFAVVPLDAKVKHQDAGPWSELGGKRPVDGDPLKLTSKAKEAGSVELSQEEREALEALGYVQ